MKLCITAIHIKHVILLHMYVVNQDRKTVAKAEQA